MVNYFQEYSTPGASPSKDEIRDFLKKSEEINKKVIEWDLDEYEKYLMDLYLFVGGYFHWSPTDFENMDINKVLYLRDKLLDSLEESLDDTNTKAMPINWNHWALLLTMRKVFGSKPN